MAQKSKFFRVAVEGATTDGRTIERSWLQQMAANFDPAKYGARIWLEHIRGTLPDSPFKAYGDVTALKSEEITLDGQKKLALFAQLDPTPDLVNLAKERQKIYTSMEVNPKFGDTGQAYLVGLGITDSPASLGTEILSFAAKNPNSNPFTGKKQAPENLFSEAVEVTLEFEDDEDEEKGVLAKVKSWRESFSKKFASQSKRNDATATELMGALDEIGETLQASVEQGSTTSKDLAALQKKFNTLETEHKELKAKFDTIDTTDANKHSRRPPATGNDPKLQTTDC
ncbi:GPO family capsid scaffolding protein [Variovorax sp. EL159]|uniref:GPO family capsid scaffolding protein n=1 Tax=Variovorax sp. EL159 TaxID=1566270 RepID=UPI00088FFBFD|nr:GPO family capsid scaffolding protein [Variovorax sp. EL159]SCX53226.1 Phage capsid scaffolding protein (GPO) serine peptidase [Variovorax sp. EL159]